MQRADSLEKALMLGKIEGRRRRGRQRMRWLDGITDSMDMGLGGLQEFPLEVRPSSIAPNPVAPERPQGSPASSSVWREDPGLLSRPCRKRRPSARDDGGVSWVSSGCCAHGGFHTRHDEDLREPFVWHQGIQVSMRMARGSTSLLSRYDTGIGPQDTLLQGSHRQSLVLCQWGNELGSSCCHTWFFSSCGGILELRRGSQPSPWVGPGKPNLPLGLRGNAGGGARVTAGPKSLENPMDRGAWEATVHGVAQSQTRLK